MTREDYIEFEANNYGNMVAGGSLVEIPIILAFKQGVLFADEHPKSPWISVKDDLPNDAKYRSQPDYTPWVLAITTEGQICVAQMLIMHGKWVWQSHYAYPIDIEYWMPIPEPPKE